MIKNPFNPKNIFWYNIFNNIISTINKTEKTVNEIKENGIESGESDEHEEKYWFIYGNGMSIVNTYFEGETFADYIERTKNMAFNLPLQIEDVTNNIYIKLHYAVYLNEPDDLGKNYEIREYEFYILDESDQFVKATDEISSVATYHSCRIDYETGELYGQANQTPQAVLDLLG